MNNPVLKHELKIVAWEVTRTCNLACIHCRAASLDKPYEGELSTEDAFRLMDQIAEVGKPIIILTGGEPLLRPDIFEIASYGTKKGFRMTMAVNGTLVTPEVARKMKDSGIKRVSVSIDGSTSESHDSFRKVPGAFERAVEGINVLKSCGVPFQINTTITAENLHELEKIHQLAISLGAEAHHIFLLVPTGRGRDLGDRAIGAAEYESALHWFYEQRGRSGLQLKATCAPHYYRILRQRAREKGEAVTFRSYGLDAVTRGCLGGISFCFISHLGTVQPCGYLEIECGNVKTSEFRDIWEKSEVFSRLRDLSLYKGKCGRCEFIRVCGGCRARAYEATGDYLAEEPLCTYEPGFTRQSA
ncbi:heme b synthase [Thermodesulforhabdus norvegica]|uniref:Heme b synthase n=1 Tax=Thermodesulforhabdus norvegica TaxID=39841 RepID=A0A1I4V022_9BACT|nr:heme b synthase [Thermodesulforhabdus norvegica]SFM94383.1 heme b synthase [Thermodesulforhabdus norvegica]